MNHAKAEAAKQAVQAHEFTDKDLKKLRRKIRSLKKSRIPGTTQTAQEMERIIQEQTHS